MTQTASTPYRRTVRLWATYNGTQRAELKGHKGPVTALAWSPDGTLLASAASNDTVRPVACTALGAAVLWIDLMRRGPQQHAAHPAPQALAATSALQY